MVKANSDDSGEGGPESVEGGVNISKPVQNTTIILLW